MLFALNGLMVTFLQIPTTRFLSGIRLTIQLALGAFIYAMGYLWIGLTGTFILFIIAMIIITTGENFISPPALSLTANLAPRGRVGRYMGIYGFSVAAGWSMGPFLGTLFLDVTKPDFFYAWGFIAVLAIFSALGFWRMTRLVPAKLNLYKEI